MQVSASLIAAQQAAREARARMQIPKQTQQASGPNFAAALGKTPGVETGFSSLPLKQVAAPASSTAPSQPAAPARMGMHVDITV